MIHAKLSDGFEPSVFVWCISSVFKLVDTNDTQILNDIGCCGSEKWYRPPESSDFAELLALGVNQAGFWDEEELALLFVELVPILTQFSWL